MDTSSILQIKNSDDRQCLLDAVETSYLYNGPARAMKSIQKDLKALCDRILSGNHPDDIQANIDTFDFLIVAIQELGKRQFSKSDLAAVNQFKATCFLAAERILQFYPFVFPFGEATGYGKAASRFHSSIRAFRPERPHEDGMFRPDSKRARVLEATLQVVNTMDHVSDKVGKALVFDKPKGSGKKQNPKP